MLFTVALTTFPANHAAPGPSSALNEPSLFAFFDQIHHEHGPSLQNHTVFRVPCTFQIGHCGTWGLEMLE